jgi:hypothetical protein
MTYDTRLLIYGSLPKAPVLHPSDEQLYPLCFGQSGFELLNLE